MSRIACSLITTPIFYVNARPHIGHAYSMILADVLARWKRQLQTPSANGSSGPQTVFFSTGTDEHGQKIHQAARDNGIMDPLKWCDLVSRDFQRLADKLNISCTDFIRTTESRHVETVQRIWKILVEKGDIYKGKHEGWYSVSDEAFYSDNETRALPDGTRIATESGKKVEWVSEENYRFKLSKYIPNVRNWLFKQQAHPHQGPIHPASRANDLHAFLDFIESNRQDLSVSRRRSVAIWGIPVPGDEDDQIIYVWMDALLNYLTVHQTAAAAHVDNNRLAPKMIHVVGKDILKFHAIYWPAILSAINHDLPERIIVHGHWLVDSQKMSKSLGNVVDPMKYCNESHVRDGLRYFLLRTGRLNSDCAFSEGSLRDCYNLELAGNLGNLLSRVFKVHTSNEMADIFKTQPAAKISNENLAEKAGKLEEVCNGHYENLLFNQVVEANLEVLNLTNRHVSQKEPWKMKDAQERLAFSAEISKILKVVLHSMAPIIPEAAKKGEAVLMGNMELPSEGLFPKMLL